MNNAQIAEIYHKMKPEDQRLFRQFKRFHKLHYATHGHDAPSHQLARGIIQEIFLGIPAKDMPRQLLRLEQSCWPPSDSKNCVSSWDWPFRPNSRCIHHLQRHQSTHRFPSLQDFHRGKRRRDKRLSHSHLWGRVLHPPNPTSNRM